MSAEKIMCAGRVWSGFRHNSCSNTGKLEHDGKMWCRAHHQPTQKAKQEAKLAMWRDEWARKAEEAIARSNAETEQARRAACFDDLLSALKSARDELMGLPRSLAYEFTHLPSIEAAIAKAEVK